MSEIHSEYNILKRYSDRALVAGVNTAEYSPDIFKSDGKWYLQWGNYIFFVGKDGRVKRIPHKPINLTIEDYEKGLKDVEDY